MGATYVVRASSTVRAERAEVWAHASSMEGVNAELAPLQSFVLPGGGPTGAMLHLARTVCRRAERRAFELTHHEAVAPDDLKYLNRLSDWLFVASRWIAKRTGESEALWMP